jgi:hypothetical protein
MANEIAGFDCLNSSSVILSKLTVKYVMGFGSFMRILEDQWKWKKWTIIFNFQQNTVVCSPEEVFIQANGIAAFDGLNFFS